MILIELTVLVSWTHGVILTHCAQAVILVCPVWSKKTKIHTEWSARSGLQNSQYKPGRALICMVTFHIYIIKIIQIWCYNTPLTKKINCIAPNNSWFKSDHWSGLIFFFNVPMFEESVLEAHEVIIYMRAICSVCHTHTRTHVSSV